MDNITNNIKNRAESLYHDLYSSGIDVTALANALIEISAQEKQMKKRNDAIEFARAIETYARKHHPAAWKCLESYHYNWEEWEAIFDAIFESIVEDNENEKLIDDFLKGFGIK